MLVRNTNVAAHMARSKLYVCPVCGNVIARASALPDHTAFRAFRRRDLKHLFRILGHALLQLAGVFKRTG